MGGKQGIKSKIGADYSRLLIIIKSVSCMVRGPGLISPILESDLASVVCGIQDHLQLIIKHILS